MSSWKGMNKKQRSVEMKRRMEKAKANKIDKEFVNYKPPVDDPNLAYQKELNQHYWDGFARAREKYEERVDVLFDYIKRLRN